MEDLKIGIVGLGLIGGSLAKALKEKAGIENIFAYNRSQNSIDEAVKEGVIKKGSTDDLKILSGCDIIFICSPVELVSDYTLKLSAISNAIITDAASTKAEIMESAKNCKRFIGGHPMTGSEKVRFKAADSHLFENALYVLCKGESCSEEDFILLKSIVEKIGAIPEIMNGYEHDKAVGIISHLPHLVSAELVNFAAENDKGFLNRLAAGGFKDITRISSSSPELWEQIISSSNGIIIKLLEAYIENLNKLSQALKEKDKDFIFNFFSKAKEYRDNIADNQAGLMPSQYEIWAEVSDKPGIIGNIATLLGDNGINIKNINIQNNREYEGGCLRISLDFEREAENALKVLTNAGYACRIKN